MTSHKKIAAGAYDALIEALSVVFWNKAPLERFLKLNLRDRPESLGLPFSGRKRETVSDSVMRLVTTETLYQTTSIAHG